MLRTLADPTTAALTRALHGQSLRQRAAANNLANIDTPGYRPTHVNFQSQLRSAVNTADPEIIDAVRPATTVESGSPLRRDGNAVDLETEMVDLAESTLHYHALIRLLSKKLQMLKSVATEGAR